MDSHKNILTTSRSLSSTIPSSTLLPPQLSLLHQPSSTSQSLTSNSSPTNCDNLPEKQVLLTALEAKKMV